MRSVVLSLVVLGTVGIGLVCALTEACFARGPQGGGQPNTMQMQARHRYGGQYPGMGQGQIMGQGQMMRQGQMWPQDAGQVTGNPNADQGNDGSALQQRKRGGGQSATKAQAQNRVKQQKKTQTRKQDGTGKVD